MRVLVFCFLALLPLGFTKKCNEHCEACDGDADIAVIRCTGKECTVESKLMDNQNQTINMDYLKEEIEDLTPEMCRGKCQEQSVHIQEGEDKNCEFFHWQENHGQPAEKKCSLQTTCPPRSTCDPIAKHCTSGQLGCSDDCQSISPCSLTKAAWKHDKFHVVCTDPHGHDINIYMDEVKDKRITPGTVCQTVRKCAAWDEQGADTTNSYYRKLAVFCDGTNIVEGEDKGTWTEMPDTGSQEGSKAMISMAGTITEQECNSTCPDIQLSTYADQWWADLICETPLVSNVLTPPNHCVLLCDNNLEKTIDCEYDAEGVKAWRDQEGNPLTDDSDIACN